jgi:hypothetical protein
METQEVKKKSGGWEEKSSNFLVTLSSGVIKTHYLRPTIFLFQVHMREKS